MKQKRILGRGLTELLRDSEVGAVAQEGRYYAQSPATLPISQITPGAAQPRKYFSDEGMKELASSIRQNGVIQPIIVQAIPDTDRYQIIAGERRWRAAKLAGLSEIPVVLQEVESTQALAIALIENIQREDLSPIEEAEAYNLLCQNHGYTQERLSEWLGKSRSHIANYLRLLQLPESVRIMVQEGQLTMGHARALINAEDPEELANKIVNEGLTVRSIEAFSPKRPKKKSTEKRSQAKDPDILELEASISKKLGLQVDINDSNGAGGEVIIKFSSLGELDKILQCLSNG